MNPPKDGSPRKLAVSPNEAFMQFPNGPFVTEDYSQPRARRDKHDLTDLQQVLVFLAELDRLSVIARKRQ